MAQDATRLTRDGLISRAENRAMVQFLDIDLEPVEEITWKQGEAIVMVDSQPNTGRHSFDPEIPVYAVIDHHDTLGDLSDVDFVDVRRNLGATCSIVTSYLIEQEIALPARLATGLLYGIETELSGWPREAGALGARMTGGGFGGSAIALVPLERVTAVRTAVTTEFTAQGWATPAFIEVESGPGARLIDA